MPSLSLKYDSNSGIRIPSHLQGAKFFSSVEFFVLIFLIKGHKLLGVSQSKSTTNASTKKIHYKKCLMQLNQTFFVHNKN